jgi:hypothetical protein
MMAISRFGLLITPLNPVVMLHIMIDHGVK